MTKDIYELANELKELIDSDERIILLNKLEKEMNNNEEVMALSYRKDVAASIYSDALKHEKEESPICKKAQHELFIAKEQLDNHPLVRDYLSAYSKVRDLYFYLNDIIFGGLSLHVKEGHK